MYNAKLPLFASKEKHVGKKYYLFLHKDFDRSKKLSQFTFNGQNFFFLANTLIFPYVIEVDTKFANFAGLYFPDFTTYRNQTLQFY